MSINFTARPSKTIQWRDAVPRIIADFVIVHCAMLMSLAVSISYQTHDDQLTSAATLVSGFRQYYFSTFVPLSLLFPVIFYLCGFYTYVRYLPEKAKLQRFVVVVLLSFSVFITANFLTTSVENLVGRSVAAPFALFAILGLVGIRVGKELLLGTERAEQDAKSKNRETGPVLVIGGAGYIGCWLVRRLLENGKRVRILDNAVYGLQPIQDLLNHPNLEYLEGDCRNIQDVVRAMHRVSSVVHLAAIVGDPACELDHKTTVEINYAATRMLVEIAKGNGVERFVFASSCSVYGATEAIMDEESPLEPVSLYGETKVASEQALLEAASDTFHPVIMRFATVFGLSGRPRFDLVVNLLTAKARQDGVITIFNGEQWRPFVHVKDLAEAIILLLDAPVAAVSSEIFNVGDNRLNHTLSDIARIIQRVIPGTRVEYVENQDRRNYRVNFDKIEKRLGFRCRHEVEAGVREIKAAFDSNEIVNYKNTRFSNLVYLREVGTPENKGEFDDKVMAAFGGEKIRRINAATNKRPFPQEETSLSASV